MIRISKYISYNEATKSQTAIRYGIDNDPTDDHLEAMKYVATEIFDPIREHFGVPIGISSFYRGPKLNKKIGGSKTSQHCFGEAIDIDADIYGKITNKQIFDYVRENLTWDQMIAEFPSNGQPAWVHVSKTKRYPDRKEILVAYKNNQNKTKYRPYVYGEEDSWN